EINQSKTLSDGGTARELATHLIRIIVGGLLAITGFIHWYLPITHRAMMPGELTRGIIVIPHGLLHILFDLNGVGYFVLVALVIGWLPLSVHHEKRLYSVVVTYAALTILAWLLLSEPAERGVLDYTDKLIELILVVLAAWMAQRCNQGMA